MIFQVFLNRSLTPEQGQAFLNKMYREIDKNPVTPTTGAPSTIKLDGVTRFDTDQHKVFPEWLAKALREKAGLSYDSFNLCYSRVYAQEQDAVDMMRWFDTSFRPWLGKIFFAEQATLARLQVRVMGDDEQLSGAQSY